MVDIVASILATDVTTVVRHARQAAMQGADWIELRLDAMPLSYREYLEPRDILDEVSLPVVVTCRLPRDGGRYDGTLQERREMLQAWIAGGAHGVDLEDWEEWVPTEPRPRLLIRSHHNLSGVTPDLDDLQERLYSMGADLIKIVVTVPDLADAAPVMELLEHTDQSERPTVAFAMGEEAWPTRILACMLRAPLIYGCVDAGSETAAGQIPLQHIGPGGIYELGRITDNTLLYGVLGNPARYSLSPWLMNRAFRQLDHDGLYLPFETTRPEAVMNMLPRRRLRGVSVTAPFKERLAAVCHELDEDADAIGALNTISFPAHGTLVGHNTDVRGVLGALRDAGCPPGDGAPAAVLGGGGAARAGAVALERMGYQVTVLARSLDRIREFARQRGYSLARMDEVVLDELRPRVIVHATPIGSLAANGAESGERVLPDWRIPPQTFVMDMVYRPARTRLLADADSAGAVVVNGADMFLHQAAAQVHWFTSQKLPLRELRRLLPVASRKCP